MSYFIYRWTMDGACEIKNNPSVISVWIVRLKWTECNSIITERCPARISFRGDFCDLVFEMEFRFNGRTYRPGERLTIRKMERIKTESIEPIQFGKMVMEGVTMHPFEKVYNFGVEAIDFLDEHFIKRFKDPRDCWYPPQDSLHDNVVWGQYCDWLMENGLFNLGGMINWILNHPIHSMVSVQDVVQERGAFKPRHLNTARYDPNDYTPEKLKKCGGDLITHEGGYPTSIRFPNIFTNEDWLKYFVTKSTVLPKLEERYQLERKEKIWKNAKKKKEVGW